MPLFDKKEKENDSFNKEDVIREIRENLVNEFSRWDWLSSRDGAFFTSDFILFRPHYIKEEIHKDENPYNPYTKVIDSTYTIMAVVYIDEKNVPYKLTKDDKSEGVFSIEANSTKDLYRALKKIDALTAG